MSEQNGKKSAQDRALAASISVAVAQAREKRAKATAEYEDATKTLYFTKDFNTNLDAIMQDRLEVSGTRFLAWLKRYAWGEYSLFAIGLDGEPRTQQDAANELGISKSRISHVVAYYEERGYMYVEGKKLYPVIAPAPGPPPEKVADSRNFSAFMEKWKVAHSSNFHDLEVARSTMKRIQKVILSDYKKSEEYATKRAATLLKIARKRPDPAASLKSSTPLEESNRRHAQRNASQPTPVEGGVQFDARAFLFGEISRMQRAYPKTKFAENRIEPGNPDHDNLVTLILKKLRTPEDEDYVLGYSLWVAAQFKGFSAIDPRERAPGKKGGPEGLGLLVSWAEDYARVCRMGSPKAVAGGND